MSNGLSFPSKEDYEDSKSKGDYSVFDEDEYRARIEGYNRVNRISQYNPDGLETLDFYLTPVAFADDEEAELTDEDGNEPVEGSRFVFFFDPKRMGLVPVISKNRKFLAAALGQSPEDGITLDSYDDLIGKEMIVAVTKKDGRNKITDVRPIRRRNRKRVEAPLAEKAPAQEEQPSESPQPKTTKKSSGKTKTPSGTTEATDVTKAAADIFKDELVAGDDEY